MAVGSSSTGAPTIRTSTDGPAWTSRSVPGGAIDSLGGVTYGNGMFVAVSNWGSILTSTNGIGWSLASSPAEGRFNLNGVGYFDGLFVAVGNLGGILTSTDGANWTERGSRIAGPDQNPVDIAYSDGLFVAVSAWTGQALTSPNAITWTVRETGESSGGLHGITHGNGLFLAVGGSGWIGTSPDGINWTPRASVVSVLRMA